MSDWDTCNHEWREIDAQDLDENRVSVKCINCGVPGEMTIKTKEVFWPAT